MPMRYASQNLPIKKPYISFLFCSNVVDITQIYTMNRCGVTIKAIYLLSACFYSLVSKAFIHSLFPQMQNFMFFKIKLQMSQELLKVH